MKILRNYLDNIKPNFVSDGKHVKWFPLFDALENLFFSYGKKTKNAANKVLNFFAITIPVITIIVIFNLN